MPSNITINMTGDNADAIRAFQGVLAEERKLDEATRKVAQENAKSAAAFKKLEDAAKRVWEQTRTPLERYNGEVAKLDRLMKTTGMTQDTYNRRVAQLTTEYHEAASAGKKAFGAEALGSIGSMAAGYLSLSSAIGLVTQGINDMEAARRAAAEGARASRFAYGKLAGVSESPEETESLIGQAKRLYREGGAGSETEAADVIYAMKSSDQMQYFNLFTQLRATGLVGDTGTMATAAAALLNSMGKPETGGLDTIIAKGLATSVPGVGTPEELLLAASRSGGKAKLLKLKDEELLAGVAIGSKTTGSPERAGTNMESLLTSLIEKGDEFQGLTFKEMILKLRDKRLSGAELLAYLGRGEAMAGYNSLEGNLDQYDKALTDIDASQKPDYLPRKLAYMNRVPSLVAARRADEAKAGEELSREDQGTWFNKAEAFRQNAIVAAREQGWGESTIWAANQFTGLGRKWLGDKFFMAGANRALGEMGVTINDASGIGVANPALAPSSDRFDQSVDALGGAAAEIKGAAAELRGAAAESRDAARQRGNPMWNHGDKQ
ncbi:MAG: hypothetical protein NTW96_25735 [Planctomycetia bacterium]|nr:hypothetical protein [Planctomycetia bacterium]